MESVPVEDLQLEPSWAKYSGNSIRFGQVGSMPVRGFFPFIAVENTKRKVIWGAQIAHGGSWQMELYRRDDALSVSGGLADREFGHWIKKIGPGEKFATPRAVLSVTAGNVDVLSQRLTSLQRRALEKLPEVEAELPIIYNEFCTTWGNPSFENIKKAAESLRGRGLKYFVIDAGWYAEKGKGWESNMGDWNPCKELFPDGIEKAVEVIRQAGMIPGIWFELEICGRDAVAFHWTDHLLQRDGYPITTGDRRFWDMRDPFVVDYLSEKVIALLKKHGFGYLKIDYNDNLGIGCEGSESLGEGLRQQIEASQKFIRKIREEIPDIVIENCSSGGHRLEPSFMEITSMSSFSDAHECLEIPIIAANLHRTILPCQSQIWVVLRKEATINQLAYRIASAFLGRMCFSGDIYDLNVKQWQIVEQGIDFYKKAVPAIKNGFSYRFGPMIRSYRHPEGWQAILRIAMDKSSAIIVIHSFEGELPDRVEIELHEAGNFKISSVFCAEETELSVKEGIFTCFISGEYTAVAILLKP